MWQKEMKHLVMDADTLSQQLDIPRTAFIASDFPLKVAAPFLSRIRPRDIHDPLLKQIMPVDAELHKDPRYTADALDERPRNLSPGLIRKYHGRALLIVTGTCPLHCRYCFRRQFAYNENRPSRNQWRSVLNELRHDKNLREIIFSGGDPLSAPDRYLSWLANMVADIPQVERLRIHTRFPVAIPQRVTSELLGWLSCLSLPVVMVLHINHSNEIDQSVITALHKLRHGGVTLLNQAVLLRDVNDNLTAQQNLCERLFAAGVLPYYLHFPDRVQGTTHFSLSVRRARRLYRQMLNHLPGYLVPRLVMEKPGAHAKTLLMPLNE